MSADSLRVLKIVPGTSVDGPGLRTSIYLAGCSHHCPGCHNPSSWDVDAGEPLTISEIVAEVEREGFNVTLSGGDPLFQIDGVVALCRELKERGYNVWCFTGYTYEAVCASPRLARVLDFIDVLVDGPFVESERDLSLRFRGSRNQRLVDVKRSHPGNIIEF